MRICDLDEKDIHIGLKIKSLKDPNKIGTIVSHEYVRGNDDYWWILWDGEEKPVSGFFWNHCKCEIVEDKKPKYSREEILEWSMKGEPAPTVLAWGEIKNEKPSNE